MDRCPVDYEPPTENKRALRLTEETSEVVNWLIDGEGEFPIAYCNAKEIHAAIEKRCPRTSDSEDNDEPLYDLQSYDPEGLKELRRWASREYTIHRPVWRVTVEAVRAMTFIDLATDDWSGKVAARYETYMSNHAEDLTYIDGHEHPPEIVAFYESVGQLEEEYRKGLIKDILAVQPEVGDLMHGHTSVADALHRLIWETCERQRELTDEKVIPRSARLRAFKPGKKSTTIDGVREADPIFLSKGGSIVIPGFFILYPMIYGIERSLEAQGEEVEPEVVMRHYLNNADKMRSFVETHLSSLTYDYKGRVYGDAGRFGGLIERTCQYPFILDENGQLNAHKVNDGEVVEYRVPPGGNCPNQAFVRVDDPRINERLDDAIGKIEDRYGATIPLRSKQAPDFIDMVALQAVLLGCAAEHYFVGRTGEHTRYMLGGLDPEEVWA